MIHIVEIKDNISGSQLLMDIKDYSLRINVKFKRFSLIHPIKGYTRNTIEKYMKFYRKLQYTNKYMNFDRNLLFVNFLEF